MPWTCENSVVALSVGEVADTDKCVCVVCYWLSTSITSIGDTCDSRWQHRCPDHVSISNTRFNNILFAFQLLVYFWIKAGHKSSIKARLQQQKKVTYANLFLTEDIGRVGLNQCDAQCYVLKEVPIQKVLPRIALAHIP